MEVIHEIVVFSRRVQPVHDLDFFDIDIIPDTRLGFFFRDRLQELLEFCRKNPSYHIISSRLGVSYNRPIEDAVVYELGIGDSNPNLMYAPKRTEETHLYIQIAKFDRDK